MFWGLTAITVLACMLAFVTDSAGWMGFLLFVGLVCGIAAALIFIDRQLRASARPEHMTEREVEALRGTLRKPGEPPRQLPRQHSS